MNGGQVDGFGLSHSHFPTRLSLSLSVHVTITKRSHYFNDISSTSHTFHPSKMDCDELSQIPLLPAFTFGREMSDGLNANHLDPFPSYLSGT
jgi:hypothetical protein